MSEAFTSDKDEDRDFTGLNLPLPRMAASPTFMRDNRTGEHTYMNLPFRGEPPLLKNDDPHYKQPQYHVDIHIEQFESTKPEDMERWTEITQKISDGLAFVSFEDRVYDKDLKGWRILLRWCEPHFDAPTEEPAV